jgi:hypothetical protein
MVLRSIADFDHWHLGQVITYAAQEMQEQLDTVYQMPYAGTDAGVQLYLRRINAKLAFAMTVERFFTGQEPDIAPEAAAARSEAELRIVDILHGNVRWDFPFADAVPRGMMPVYQLLAGATVSPNPNNPDPNIANPTFVISGQTRYRMPQF